MRKLAIVAALCPILAGAVSAWALTIVADIDAGGRIPPTGQEGTSVYTFTISGLSGMVIDDIDLRLAIEHPRALELSAKLEHGGAGLWLFRNLPGPGKNFADTVFDDEALADIASGSPSYVGSYNPQGSAALDVFDGLDPGGVWTLTVSDSTTTYGPDTGWLIRIGDYTGYEDEIPWPDYIGTQLILNAYVPDDDPPDPAGYIPEPLTMLGVFMGVGGLGRYVRRRIR